MKTGIGIGVFLIAIGAALAQGGPPPGGRGAGGRGGPGGGGPGGGGGGGAFPARAPGDPAAIDRGKATYGVHCAFCHGSDARGGEGGPNLIRSQLVLNDQKGELIAPVVQNGRLDAGMPKFDLTAAQIADISEFIHTFRVGGRDMARNRPPSVLVGDAGAGEQYFHSKCQSCHSVTGDLKGFAAKFPDPKTLQQVWLAPGGGRFGGPVAASTNVPPTTVTVTLAGGKKAEGRLVRIDDYTVTLIDGEGNNHSFRRAGDTPKVEVHDPLEPHRQLLTVYTDADIHNLTAYLATLK
jgi:mono/diheme cytochrome c family protein